MAAIAPIVVADNLAANHTFSPEGIDANGVAIFKDRDHGSAVSFYTLSARLRGPVGPADGPNRVFRNTVKMVIPVIATINGVDTLVSTMSGYSEFVIPESATLQQRKDLRALFRNALGNSQIGAMVETLEQIY